MLQFISHHNSRYGYIEGIRMALEGGCRWVQLRMKEADEATFLSTAQEAVALCRSYHARLILDDRVEWELMVCTWGARTCLPTRPVHSWVPT